MCAYTMLVNVWSILNMSIEPAPVQISPVSHLICLQYVCNAEAAWPHYTFFLHNMISGLIPKIILTIISNYFDFKPKCTGNQIFSNKDKIIQILNTAHSKNGLP